MARPERLLALTRSPCGPPSLRSGVLRRLRGLSNLSLIVRREFEHPSRGYRGLSGHFRTAYGVSPRFPSGIIRDFLNSRCSFWSHQVLPAPNPFGLHQGFPELASQVLVNSRCLCSFWSRAIFKINSLARSCYRHPTDGFSCLFAAL